MATYEELQQAINAASNAISQCTVDLQTVHETATTELRRWGSPENAGSGTPGANGKSAYELAVDNGFEGTEEEWLASLKGEDGVIGSDGASAYEIAVDNGFEGTEEEWLASLRASEYASEEGLPIGTIIAYSGVNNPTGWLDCDGSAVSRTVYADLFTVIGTTYGEGDGETTFNLPDYRDRFIQGSLEAGTAKAAGLPNITGTINGLKTILGTDGNSNAATATGAFSKSATNNGGMYSSNTGPANDNFSFNAHNSNAIYGNSNTVQPPALTARILIKALLGANTVVTTAELDYDNCTNITSCFSAVKAITIDSWGSGYGVTQDTPCPSSGMMLVAVKSVDASKVIAVLSYPANTSDVPMTVGVMSAINVGANNTNRFLFPVNKGDRVTALVVGATDASKVVLSAAVLTPYKVVTFAGRDGAQGIPGANGFSGGNIDWEHGQAVDLLNSLEQLDASSNNMHWKGTYTAPFDGICVVELKPHVNVTASNLGGAGYISSSVNSQVTGYAPLRPGNNYFTIPGVRAGDTVMAHLLWPKSAANGKPAMFTFVFKPYQAQYEDTYSSSEVKTNKVWIDGKAVYRKAFSFTMTADNNTHEYADLSSLNIDTLISIGGSAGSLTAPNAKLPVNYNVAVNGNSCSTYINGSNKLTQITNNVVHNNAPCVVVLEYTKTSE